MPLIIIVILISLFLLIAWSVYAKISLNWDLAQISNSFSIFAVISATLVLADFSPKIVHLKNKSEMVLHNIEAIERISNGPDQSDKFDIFNCPIAFFSATVSNIGNAIDYNLSIEINSDDNFLNFNPFHLFVVYILDEKYNPWTMGAKLSWLEQAEGSALLEKDGSAYRFDLPIIEAKTSKYFVVGFRSYEEVEGREIVAIRKIQEKISQDSVKISLLKKSESLQNKPETLVVKKIENFRKYAFKTIDIK